MELFIYLILFIIVFFGSLGIVYVLIYNKLQGFIIRINESESIIDESLRIRYDLIISGKNIIQDNIDNKFDLFEELENCKKKNISNFEFDRKSTECINLIFQLKKDYYSLDSNQSFKELISEIKRSEEKIISAKTFYNRYTSNLNDYVRKFPSNIIAKIHGIKEKNYFDNKNMNDDNINDFKI